MDDLSKPGSNRVLAGAFALSFALFLAACFKLESSPLLLPIGSEIRRFITFPLFTIGKLAFTLLFVLKSCTFLILLFFGSTRLRQVLYSFLIRHTALGRPHGYMLARFASLGLFVVGLIVGLESAGLDLSSLTILGGTLGIGVGFGLQPIVSNWVAGVVLLIEQSVRIGDRIDMDGASGVVMKIGGRSTWIRTYSNEVLIVPNFNLTSNLLTNWTVNDPKVRLAIPIGVGYSSDPEQVRALLLTIASDQPDVLKEPAPEVIFRDFGTNSSEFLLRFWTMVGDRDSYGLTSDLYFSIFRIFRLHGIEIPVAQKDGKSLSPEVPISIEKQTGPEYSVAS